MTNQVPKAPAGLKAAGKALWASVVTTLDLDAHEERLLLEACRISDRLDDLDAVLRRDGLATPDGRANPLLVEARQQGIALTRVLATLRLPAGLEDVEHRPQRRGAARGAYQPTPLRRDA